MPKHSNSGGGVKSRPESAVRGFPKNVNYGGMRSDSHAKDDKNFSIAQMHDKMRQHAHSVNSDHSNLPLKGVPDGGNLKGGK